MNGRGYGANSSIQSHFAMRKICPAQCLDMRFQGPYVSFRKRHAGSFQLQTAQKQVKPIEKQVEK